MRLNAVKCHINVISIRKKCVYTQKMQIEVVIVGGMQPTCRNDEGFLIMNIYDFLLGKVEI